VCSELLVDPVVSPCGHDLCKACYERWQRACTGLVVCPLCRAPMPSNLGVCLRLKNTIESLYPEASKQRQEELQSQSAGTEAEAKQQMRVDQLMVSASYAQAQWQWQWAASMSFAMHYMQQPAMAAASGCTPVAAGDTAVGMPVLDVLCQQRGMQQQQQACAPCTAPATQTTVMATPEAVSAAAAAAAPTGARWQSVADVPLRLECARAIMRLVQQRGLQSALGDAALSAVRSVEVALYRSAPSRDAYMDLNTLEARMVSLIRQRAAAAAARRATLHRRAAAAQEAAADSSNNNPLSPRAASAARLVA